MTSGVLCRVQGTVHYSSPWLLRQYMLTCQNKLNRDSTSGQVYLDQRNQNVAEIMDGARVGNVLLDFGSQFTHAFWMGASTYTPVYRPECTRGRTLVGCSDPHNGPVLLSTLPLSY